MHHTVQMIDEDGNFCLEPLKLAVEEQWKLGGRELADVGLDYSLISVLGAQSTGKSTLLNALFGTDFAEMDATKGRTQTTRGMWLAPASRDEFQVNAKAKANEGETDNTAAAAGNCLLVLDSEGTDSKERWEEHEAFERRTALFSLALSNILLVNMWYQDIGRYEAMNYSLLRTVFEVHLALFANTNSNNLEAETENMKGTSSPKTLLLFIIRDHHTTPKDVLEKSVIADINHLWSEIRKPDGYEECVVNDLFDFSFETLPHKMLAPVEFDHGVDQLRTRFTVPESADYLLGDRYRKTVPIDGFVTYSSNVWDTIVENKELNLPSQREMVALFRCDAIADEAYVTFGEKANQLKLALERTHDTVPIPIECSESSPSPSDHILLDKAVFNVADAGNVLSDLGAQINAAAQETLHIYSTQADRYQKSVANRKRLSLLDRMTREASNLSERQMENASTWLQLSCVAWLDAARRIGSEQSTWMANYASRGEELVNDAVEALRVACDGAMPPTTPNDEEGEGEGDRSSVCHWDCKEVMEDIIDGLRSSVTDSVMNARPDHIQALVSTKTTALKKALNEKMEAAYSDLDANPGVDGVVSGLWSSIRDILSSTLAGQVSELREELSASFRASTDELASTESSMHVSAVNIVEQCAVEGLKFLPLRLRQRFDAFFRYDRKSKSMLPRVWRKRDDVAAIYTHALESAYQLLDAYASVRLDPRQDIVCALPETKSQGEGEGEGEGVGKKKVEDDECPKPLFIMTEKEINAIMNKLRLDTEPAYLEAVHIVETSKSTGNIPLWAVVLILVLGFNEFVAVLSSPLLLLLLLAAAGAFYIVHTLGLGGGVGSILDNVLEASLENLKERISMLMNSRGSEGNKEKKKRD